MTSTALATYEEQASDLALPSAAFLTQELAAVKAFQLMIRQNLIAGSDYGVIPGTGTKPTLLKPGAEKMAKLLGLADHYEIADKVEDWDRPLFRYVVKCQLRSVRTGSVVAESFGECNSLESKYRWRWVFASQLPGGHHAEGMVSRSINTRNGPATQYRLDNDDVFSLINTILKMAQKRALVGAALSAGRLSELFTQDIEDIAGHDDGEPHAAPQGIGPRNAAPAPAAGAPNCPTHNRPARENRNGDGWYCSAKTGEGADGKATFCTWKAPKAAAPVTITVEAQPAAPKQSLSEALMDVAASMGWEKPELRAWLEKEGLIADDGKTVEARALFALKAYKAEMEKMRADAGVSAPGEQEAF